MPRVTTDVVKLNACLANCSRLLLVLRKFAKSSHRMWMLERSITQLLSNLEKTNYARQWREKTSKLRSMLIR